MKRILKFCNSVKIKCLRVKMGRAYISKDLQKAIFFAQKILTYDKNDEGSLWLLVDSYYKLRNYDKTEEAANHLLSIYPDNLQSLQKLAKIYFARKDYRGSYFCITRALNYIGSDIDDLLNELESHHFFSGLARNVRHTLCDNEEQNKSWIRWALEFKKWYESNSHEQEIKGLEGKE